MKFLQRLERRRRTRLAESFRREMLESLLKGAELPSHCFCGIPGPFKALDHEFLDLGIPPP
jgi:hypothetical protein